MIRDLVIGLDSSTQSTKAIAWNRAGEAVAEGRAPIAMELPAAGEVEQRPEDWWDSARTALRQLTGRIDPARVAGLAISCQRDTVAFLDAAGEPVRPAMVWLDQRARDEVAPFSQRIGVERLHRITGKPPDVTPTAYRLAWMRRHAAADLDRTALITDVHAYLALRLTGRAVASWTSADPFGVVDLEARAWSVPILAALGLAPERFPALVPPGTRIGPITEAAELGLPAATPLFAAGGDGQCAGLGVDAVRPGVVYLNLGTAIITGSWSATPAIGRDWRTVTSPTGEGYFLEGSQRAGTFLVDWFVERFAGGRDRPGAEILAELEAAAAALPVGAEGVTVCPYLAGCMNPHWDPAASASISGLAPIHGTAHVFRAVLEALTVESVRTIEAFAASGLAPARIVAVGGGAQNRLWIRMLADASGIPVAISRSLEAASLGAAISAAVGSGWFAGFADAARAMCRTGPGAEPDPVARPAWALLSRRQAAAYRPAGG